MKKILSLALFLAVVAGLSGAALSYVHSVTDPIIQEAALASVKGSLEEIYPGGSFKKLEANLADFKSVSEVYEAEGKGYIYNCSVTGYGGASTPIKFLVALDKDGTYKGFVVLDCSGETNGFGSKVGDKPFIDSVVGKNIGDSIDTIAGATISSKAVVTGIEEATAHYEENLK